MKIEAIVYTSMTGFTAQYANMLSNKTGLPAYTLAQAKEKLVQAIDRYRDDRERSLAATQATTTKQ